jgi:putative addiction module component (TIGR02574 family)
MDNIKLNDFSNLSPGKKLELVYAIWDSVKDEDCNSEIPEWHKEILDKRLKKIENGEMEFVSWERVKEKLQETMKH